MKKKEKKVESDYKDELWEFLGDYFDRRSGIVKSRHRRLITICQRAMQSDRNKIIEELKKIRNSIEIGANPIDYLNDFIDNIS